MQFNYSEPRKQKWIIFLKRARILYGVGLVFALMYFNHYYLSSPSELDFALFRHRYEALVVKVKLLNLPQSDKAYFYFVDSGCHPSSLRKESYKSGNTMAGRIQILHQMDGRYVITIVTDDEGHFGAFGYVYSEIPLGPELGTAHQKIVLGSDLVFLRKHLTSNWWIGYNNLF